MNGQPKHILSIAALGDAHIKNILALADKYAEKLKQKHFHSDLLKGRVILNAFFEASTRTRISFEMAAKRLGAEVINFDPDSGSGKKGESFSDTIKTLDSIGPDAFVIRHAEQGKAEAVAQLVNCPVINAGDGAHEHPTQALLDALTIRRAKGRVEKLVVAICGDVAYSRVAHSNIILLSRLGARIRVIAPAALMPQKFPVPGIETFESMRKGLEGCDIIMTQRPQKERMEKALAGSADAFFNEYGLDSQKLSWARPDALVMNPGPITRGVEVADSVADGQRSLILEQVRNGVAVRMAVLEALLI